MKLRFLVLLTFESSLVPFSVPLRKPGDSFMLFSTLCYRATSHCSTITAAVAAAERHETPEGAEDDADWLAFAGTRLRFVPGLVPFDENQSDRGERIG